MTKAACAAAAMALLLLTLLFFPPVGASGGLGLCLPSPNEWTMPRFLSWLLGTGAIFISVFIIASANKRYNFVAEAEPIVSLSLLLLIATNCLCTSRLSTSSLLLLGNAAGLYLLFSTYESRNATREFFTIASIPAIGAMFQYAFLTMIPVYIGGGLLMKSFRPKELVAFLFGLFAPYWIAVGLGWIPFDSFRLPETLSAFKTPGVSHDIFLTLVEAGAMALLGIILSLYNGVRLFSRNSRLRCMHSTINLMGIVAVLAIIFDFDNFTAYFATVVLWLSVQIATTLSFYNIRRPLLAMIIAALAFIPFYILEL